MKLNMKTMLSTIVLGSLLITGSANAEFYSIDIKRVDNNVAIVNGNIPIEWQFGCYEYPIGTEQAILKYDNKYSFDNYVLFKNGNKCNLKSNQ